MEKKDISEEKMISVPESVLLSLVAEALKGRVLFPEMLADVKEHLRNTVRVEKKDDAR